MSEYALGYSSPIEMPATRKQGLMNNIQMIINAAERGDIRNAILIAVDLKDTISGNANPFSSVTDGLTADAVSKEVAAAREIMEQERNSAVAQAFAKGAAHARKEMLSRLQEAA